MLIAVTTEKNTLDSAVSKQFESCGFLLVVETDTMKFDTRGKRR